MDEKILTADGTETFFNQEYREAYHSTKAGAYTESLHKFIIPCRITELSKKGKISILDVGFGLGYNVAVAVKKALEVNPEVSIEIISIEKDKDVFNRIKNLNIPDSLKDIYSFILSGMFTDIDLNGVSFYGYLAQKENVFLKVLIGEGRKLLKKISDTGILFDAVFYDAFSPKVNTEMWTVDIFKIVRSLIKEEAILATYSASLAVRKGFLEAGFKIGLVEPIGRKSYSTVATIKGDIPPLTEKEKNRLENSPYAFPYEDPDLSLPPSVIKENWEKKLKERLKSLNLSHNFL